MQFYFTLQWRRLQRGMLEAGLHPLVGIGLAILLFAGLVIYVFLKTSFAAWIIVGLGWLAVFTYAGERVRQENLRLLFAHQTYWRIRVVENTFIAFPFLVALLVAREWIAASVVLPGAWLPLLVHWKWTHPIVLPTPFKRQPFEFPAGFRKQILGIALAFFLLVKAIEVDNYNLGIFSLALVFLLAMLFYGYPEHPWFVWIFNHTPAALLKHKLWQAGLNMSLLGVPVLVALVIAFPERWLISSGVFIGGFIYLLAVVLAKYAAFPRAINIPQVIILALCVWFPPVLLFAIPLFYSRAKRQLQKI